MLTDQPDIPIELFHCISFITVSPGQQRSVALITGNLPRLERLCLSAVFLSHTIEEKEPSQTVGITSAAVFEGVIFSSCGDGVCYNGQTWASCAGVSMSSMQCDCTVM